MVLPHSEHIAVSFFLCPASISFIFRVASRSPRHPSTTRPSNFLSFTPECLFSLCLIPGLCPLSAWVSLLTVSSLHHSSSSASLTLLTSQHPAPSSPRSPSISLSPASTASPVSFHCSPTCLLLFVLMFFPLKHLKRVSLGKQSVQHCRTSLVWLFLLTLMEVLGWSCVILWCCN